MPNEQLPLNCDGWIHDDFEPNKITEIVQFSKCVYFKDAAYKEYLHFSHILSF